MNCISKIRWVPVGGEYKLGDGISYAYGWLRVASDLIDGVWRLEAAAAALDEHELVIRSEKKRADRESASHVVVDNAFRTGIACFT